MTLSTVAARALEQVKVGLYMLYGAGYFTEDEWVAIDRLIHKGKYEFTQGPSNHGHKFDLVEPKVEEQLIDFADWDSPLPSSQIQEITSSAIKDLTTVPEQRVSSASSSSSGPRNSSLAKPFDSTKVFEVPLISPLSANFVDSSAAETSNETSAEASSDEDYSRTAGDAGHLFNLSATTTPVSGLALPKASNPIPSSIRGTSRTPEPKQDGKQDGAGAATIQQDSSIEAHQPTKETENACTLQVTEPTTPALPTLKPLMHSWASDTESMVSRAPSPAKQPTPRIPTPIKKQPSPVLKIPKPSKYFQQPAVLTKEYIQNYELFVKYHGHPPKSLSDFYQPSNPGYKGPKPPKNSAASSGKSYSVKTKSTVKASTPSIPLSEPLARDRVIMSHHDFPKQKMNHLDIKAGDAIRVHKHVSGITYLGENLRTKEFGHFPETLFRKTNSETVDSKPSKPVRKASGTTQHDVASEDYLSTTSETPAVGNWLDGVEEGNAAEWDKDSVLSKLTQARNPSVTSEDNWRGLSSGKIIEEVPKRPDSLTELEMKEIIVGRTRVEMGVAAFNQRFEEIILIQEEFIRRNQVLLHPQPRPNGLRSTPLMPVIPKTATCWHWKTGRGCRFGAEGCRDLHGFIPQNPFEEGNMRDGKASWGAFFDYHPSYLKSDFFPVPSTTAAGGMAAARKVGAGDAERDGGDGKARMLTCWYWGTEGYCQYTRDTCKYLHEYGEWGMAPRPGTWKEVWARWSPTFVEEKNSGPTWRGKGKGWREVPVAPGGSGLRKSIWGQGVERAWVRGGVEGGDLQEVGAAGAAEDAGEMLRRGRESENADEGW